MSRKFLVPPSVPSGSANPGSGNLGDLFFNTTTNTLVVYNGTAWVTLVITDASTHPFMLMGA